MTGRDYRLGVLITVGPNIAFLKSVLFANPNSICAFRLTGSEWASRVQIGTVKKIAYRILSCIAFVSERM